MRRPSFGETLITAAALTVLAPACSGDDQPEDTRTDIEKTTTCLANSLDERNGVNTVRVPGEAINVKLTYSTEYDVDEWRITDPKTLDIMLEVVPVSADGAIPTVLVENMHAEARVKADESGLDDLLVDEFDDHLHAGDQPGFAVTPEHAYRETFAIEGQSDAFRDGWDYQISGLGDLEIDSGKSELNEDVLRHYGAFGQEISIVVDLLVRDQPDELYRKTVVSDRILVPLEGHECGRQNTVSTTPSTSTP